MAMSKAERKAIKRQRKEVFEATLPKPTAEGGANAAAAPPKKNQNPPKQPKRTKKQKRLAREAE